MGVIERTECIQAPIEEVFGYIAHPERNKEWIPDVVESEKITEGPNGPGSRFRFFTRAPMGLRVAAEAEIVAVTPPTRLEFRSTGGLQHSGRWDLESRDGLTCVRFRIEYRLTALEAAVLRASGLRGFLERHVRQSVAGLRRAVESRESAQRDSPLAAETPPAPPTLSAGLAPGTNPERS